MFVTVLPGTVQATASSTGLPEDKRPDGAEVAWLPGSEEVALTGQVTRVG